MSYEFFAPQGPTADCNKPSIHATPSGYPVSFVNAVKTNLASVLGAVARMTAEVAIQAVIDQNTTTSVRNRSFQRYGRLRTSSFVPFAQEAIAEDVEANGEERDGQKVQVRMP
jgi:hypothetical protein